YRLVQELSAKAIASGESFKQVLLDDPRVDLSPKQLDEVFSVAASVARANLVFDALKSTDS
ncbi:MAG: hypothetical protein ACKPAF_08585, partial [Actinomycetota bacterium]